jgi:hypothetical protein
MKKSVDLVIVAQYFDIWKKLNTWEEFIWFLHSFKAANIRRQDIPLKAGAIIVEHVNLESILPVATMNRQIGFAVRCLEWKRYPLLISGGIITTVKVDIKIK